MNIRRIATFIWKLCQEVLIAAWWRKDFWLFKNKPPATLPYYCPALEWMRKLSATIFESFGRGIPLDREMTVGAEKVRKRGVNKWRRRSGISITEALVGRVAVRPDHKYITKLLPEIPPSLCGCTKKSCTNTIQIHTQIQNKHNLYHQQKVAGNLVKSICI